MADYTELVKDLRYCVSTKYSCIDCPHNIEPCCENMLLTKAADAIESLSETVATAYNENADFIAYYEESKPRWIPVTERLPEEYVGVLCYCSRNGQYGCGEWCKEDNGTIYWIGLNGMIPTHWMPLPEPPKEEQT